VYMLDSKYESPSHRRLGPLLAKRFLVLVPIDPRHGLYHLRDALSRRPRRR
jgi:hypothetical protein